MQALSQSGRGGGELSLNRAAPAQGSSRAARVMCGLPRSEPEEGGRMTPTGGPYVIIKPLMGSGTKSEPYPGT